VRKVVADFSLPFRHRPPTTVRTIDGGSKITFTCLFDQSAANADDTLESGVAFEKLCSTGPWKLPSFRSIA
jgi:hypothetical protein